MENKYESIELRRKTLYDYYDLPSEAKEKSEGIFKRMEQLADTCEDRGSFELAFASSSINTEYNALFTEFVKYAKAAKGMPTTEEIAAQAVKDQAESIVKQQARNGIMGLLVNILPKSISDWFIYRGNNVEPIATIKSTRNKIDLFHQLFKKH